MFLDYIAVLAMHMNTHKVQKVIQSSICNCAAWVPHYNTMQVHYSKGSEVVNLANEVNFVSCDLPQNVSLVIT